MMMTSSTLGHMANISDFISSSISVLTTNTGMIVEPHAIALAEDKFPTNDYVRLRNFKAIGSVVLI